MDHTEEKSMYRFGYDIGTDNPGALNGIMANTPDEDDREEFLSGYMHAQMDRFCSGLRKTMGSLLFEVVPDLMKAIEPTVTAFQSAFGL